MIEAPEALCLAEQLNEVTKGKVVTDVISCYTPHRFAFFNGGPEAYPGMLLGKPVSRACAYGGMVQMNVGDAKVVFSDGANLRYCAPEAKLPDKHQLLIGFEDQSCVVVSVRMYGAVWCFVGDSFEGNLISYYKGARDKPQVLSDSFDDVYFMSLINDEQVQKKSAKAFLATDQMIPGLGNGVLQDILYLARVHPKTKIASLSQTKREELFTCVKNVLQEIYRQGGRCSEKDLFNRKGGYIPYLSKDTVGNHCMRCGDYILKENYLGGSVYYCNTCQREEK